jgi:hypothetical protein
MARLVGRSLAIGLCAESAYGDGVTTSAPLYWTTPSGLSAPIVRADVTAVPDLGLDDSGLTRLDFVSKKYVDFEFSQPMDMDNDGMLLRAGVGSVATTGSGPYTHVYTLDIDQPATLGGVVEMAEEDGTFSELEFSGGQVASIRWEIQAGGYCVETMRLFGNVETDWTGTPVQTPASFSRTKATIPFAKQATTVSVLGNTYSVTSATVEFNRNLSPDLQHLGEVGIAQQYPGQNTGATIEFVMPMPSFALLTDLLAETQGTVTLTLTNGARSVSWALENAQVIEHSESINGVGLAELRVRVAAHGGGTYGAKCTVINALSAAVQTQGTAA